MGAFFYEYYCVSSNVRFRVREIGEGPQPFLLCVFLYDSSGDQTERKPRHRECSNSGWLADIDKFPSEKYGFSWL